jgi:hypothetical protein
MQGKAELHSEKISFRYRRFRRVLLACVAIVLLACGRGDASASSYQEVASFFAPEAYQAAAADDDFIYAIEDTSIAKYSRRSFKLIAKSTGTAHHLNSGFVWEGKVYCAHTTPHGESEIMTLDPVTMVVGKFKDLSDHPGKITWVVRDAKFWWINFAFYGSDNASTYLAKFDEEWRELGRWYYPREVVSDLRRQSISGGVVLNSIVLATGHDKKVIYEMKFPAQGQVLQFVDAIPSPFPGQGLATDPVSDSLVGIDRDRHEVVFARQTIAK